MQISLIALFAGLAIGADDLSPAARASSSSAPDTAVVCPADFVETLQPWIAYRRRQGHRIEIVSGDQSSREIREALREVSRGGRLSSILIVGDATGPGPHVPAHQAAAVVNVRFGSEPEIATDNWYADFDNDHLPDAAIGRLPINNEAELTAAIEKIIAYERAAEMGAWRRKVNFVAGVGGFGAIADTVLETATKRFLTDGVPAGYATSMTYASWRSPYCPDPRRFHDAALTRLNEGCLFWVYIGHGQRRSLDRVQTPVGQHHILDAEDAHLLASTQGAPIALFLACYTGAYDGPRDCLAEAWIKQPGGPVAVLAGSRVTMPYSMALLAHGMLEEYFTDRRTTLGEVVLGAKRRLAALPEDNEQDDSSPAFDFATSDGEAEGGELTAKERRRLIDALANVISPSRDLLHEERLEHLSLFNLLGDPLLRLPQPQPIEFEVRETVRAGEAVEAIGSAPIAGRYTVELVCRRDLFKAPLESRSSFDPSHAALTSFQEIYRKANDHVWVSGTFDSPGGDFHIRLEAPPEASGSCHVRVYAEGADGFALGARELYIEPAGSRPPVATREAAELVRPQSVRPQSARPITAERQQPINPVRTRQPR